MKNSPFFSIIIPTYNRAPFIKETINSALQQHYNSFEIIVVDDGSQDNTEEVVNAISSPKIRYYKKKNRERGAARNFGMKRAKGQYITFLDSDDRYYPQYLENAYESLLYYNYPFFLHVGYEVVSEKGKSLRKVDHLKNNDIYMFVRGNPLSCLGVFLHQQVVQQHTFKEERALAGAEDWEMWIRIATRYGIKTDNRISAAMIQHQERSLQSKTAYDLLRSKKAALKHISEDEAVQKKLGHYKNQIWAFGYTYISLNLALAKFRSHSLLYLVKGVKNSYKVVFTRRFVAIIKHLLIP